MYTHLYTYILTACLYIPVPSKKEQRFEVKHNKDSESSIPRAFKSAQNISFIIFTKISICPFIQPAFTQASTNIQHKQKKKVSYLVSRCFLFFDDS